MKPFSYIRSHDIDDAVTHGQTESSRYLGGGTTLLDCMKLYIEQPDVVVDVNHISSRIDVLADRVRIGAAVRNSDLAYHETIRNKFPLLSQAILAGATPQIRNMATVGGNLLQRTRCSYFRDTYWPCNKRDAGTGCSAIDGDNRPHAILGTSEKCIATHPSDMCVAMVALDAVIETARPGGGRRIPIHEFHVAYGDDPARESVLEHGELIVAVELPLAPAFARAHYLKIRDRSSFEFALVSVAAAIEVVHDRVEAVRIALGGVATKPWRAIEAEQALIGQQPTEENFWNAAQAAVKDARPQRDNGFKVELARRAISRALGIVTGSN